jgi:hypothetical protein
MIYASIGVMAFWTTFAVASILGQALLGAGLGFLAVLGAWVVLDWLGVEE